MVKINRLYSLARAALILAQVIIYSLSLLSRRKNHEESCFVVYIVWFSHSSENKKPHYFQARFQVFWQSTTYQLWYRGKLREE